MEGASIYRSYGTGDNHVLFDAQELNLTGGDDMDALTRTLGANVCFSIDANSASIAAGVSANDIFINNITSLFASGVADIGLNDSDDIDALSFNDEYQPGVLNPGIDSAYFSLSAQSPSSGPADLLFTDFSGSFSLWKSAADLGLAPGTELDALSTPEPASVFVWSFLGLLGASISYRRCRARA